MFNSSEYPKSLEESRFTTWLEQGRASRIPYTYLLIIWDELEGEYPAQQLLVAAYDLYSESRVG
jgi:hypothetical protein